MTKNDLELSQVRRVRVRRTRMGGIRAGLLLFRAGRKERARISQGLREELSWVPMCSHKDRGSRE